MDRRKCGQPTGEKYRSLSAGIRVIPVTEGNKLIYLTSIHERVRAMLDCDLKHTDLSTLPFNVGSKIWLRCQNSARAMWGARCVSLASLVLALVIASTGIFLCSYTSLPSSVGLSVELLGWFSALIGMHVHRALVARLARPLIGAEILNACPVCGSELGDAPSHCPECGAEHLRGNQQLGWCCRTQAA